MRIGMVYPQTEYGNDPAAIRDYAQTAEGLGFTHILVYDHVLGANPQRPGGLNGPYTHQSAFLEPFSLFSYMASFTQHIEFTTGILILPQRQTALVAKQTATLDILSAGRLRLGVGLGWNEIEYEALNENFHDRGKRIEEQVQVLRALWTEPLVTFNGKYHKISDAGLNPLPVQRPIPIWFGGHVEPVLRRTARLGDGWMPNYRQASQAKPSLEKLAHFLDEAGRPWSGFGIEARLQYDSADTKGRQSLAHEWRQAGATHLSINTMGCGFSTPAEHLRAIADIAREFDL
jgi:probable F420-dependent oxidoreductase